MRMNGNNVVIKDFTRSAVKQTTLGGLIIRLLVVNFLYCKCVKNYEIWLTLCRSYFK